VYCNTIPSWQGDPLRAPVASPRPLAPSGRLAQFRSQQTVSPVNHSQTFGRLHHRSGSLRATPTPHGRGRSCPAGPQTISWRPLHGDDFIETRKGEFGSPYPWTIPSTQEPSSPLWNPDHAMEANRPPIGCRQRLAAGHDQSHAALDRTNIPVGSGGRPLPTGQRCLALSTTQRAKTLPPCVSIGYTSGMNKDSGLRIRVERGLRERFLAVCRAQDKPAAQVLREFMHAYIAENESAAVPQSKLSNRPHSKGRLSRGASQRKKRTAQTTSR